MLLLYEHLLSIRDVGASGQPDELLAAYVDMSHPVTPQVVDGKGVGLLGL